MKDLYKRYFCENMFCKKPRRFDCMIITDEGYNGVLPYGWKYVSNEKRLFHPTNDHSGYL